MVPPVEPPDEDSLTAAEGEAEIDRIVRRIVDRFRPDRIVLFGSRAEGRAAPDSDADLLIVWRTDLPFYQRPPEIRRAIRPHHLSLDLIVLTPEEAARLELEPSSFLGDILRTGKVLHGRRVA